MQLQDQVCSLELAKQLKELGVKQESYCKWNVPNIEEEKYLIGEENFDIENYTVGESTPQIFTQEEWEKFTDEYNPISSEMFSAFTVAELGEMLPEKTCWRGYTNYNKKWSFMFGDFKAEATTEADARAKMLIYLIENKLITL